MSLPPIPDAFEWTTQSWGAALRCRPLSAIAPHLFTTRQLSLVSPKDLMRLAESVGAGAVAMAKQVHGRTVVVVRDGDGAPAAMPERGYARLYRREILQADRGCDFDFLRKHPLGDGRAQ